MTARLPQEAHRGATPLELFFDLVFVVAVARGAEGLHHAIAGGHALDGVILFAMVFFAIWWAWMNFTWFASAYDCDDVPYRLAVFMQMTGALIMAAGISRMFAGDFSVGTAGYVVMRLAMVGQWLRAARNDVAHRTTARRFALGIAVVQLGWVLRLWLPPATLMPGFLLLSLAELGVPIWAEQSARTTWHPRHMAERYGLFTIIVLGESILAATIAVQAALTGGAPLIDLLPTIIGGLLIVYSLWWLYFYRPVHGLLTSLRRAFVWGYGHYFVFGSVAAVGAGLAVAIDQTTDHAAVSRLVAGFAVAVPTAVYVVSVWVLHAMPGEWKDRWFGPVAALLILLTPLTGQAIPLTALILVAMLAIKLARRYRDGARAA
jgi:low temperature requirement protein LtrA